VLVALEIVLLAAHLLCMNIAAGAPLIAMYLEWRDRRGDAVAPQAAKYLSVCIVVALLIGALLGLAIGWLRWTPEYQQVWQVQLKDKLNTAIQEFVVSGTLLVVYLVWRRFVVLPTRWGYIARSVILLLAATNLLYHFPPLLIVAGKLAENGFGSDVEVPQRTLVFREFWRLRSLDETPALWIHFGLASVAVGGVVLFGLALRRQRSDEDPRGAKRIAAWGSWPAFVATGLQLVVGLWLLATTPPDLQARLTGSSLWPTVFLVVSIGCALWLLRELANVALGEATRGAMIRCMIALTVVVVLMTAARQLSRQRDAVATPGPPAVSLR
jgi:hypothetical protein